MKFDERRFALELINRIEDYIPQLFMKLEAVSELRREILQLMRQYRIVRDDGKYRLREY